MGKEDSLRNFINFNFRWTFFSQTANIGDTSIVLTQPALDWNVGELIVIAPTDYINREAENRTISAISPDGLTISF